MYGYCVGKFQILAVAPRCSNSADVTWRRACLYRGPDLEAIKFFMVVGDLSANALYMLAGPTIPANSVTAREQQDPAEPIT